MLNSQHIYHKVTQYACNIKNYISTFQVPTQHNATTSGRQQLFNRVLQRQRVQEPDTWQQFPEEVPPDDSEGAEEEDGVLLRRSTFLRAESYHKIFKIPHVCLFSFKIFYKIYFICYVVQPSFALKATIKFSRFLTFV